MNLQQIFILILIAFTVFMTWFLIGAQVKREPRIPLKERLQSKEKQVSLNQVIRSDSEWQKLLSEDDYNVLRRGKAEKAYTGNLWNETRAGTYYCKGCDLELFSSKHKEVNELGWPNFSKPVNEDHISFNYDYKFFTKKIEATCACCHSHLGQISEDETTKSPNYCINGSSLKFIPEEEVNTKTSAF